MTQAYYFKLIHKLIVYIALIGLIGLIIYLLWLDTIPGGKFEQQTDFLTSSSFFSQPVPVQRVEETESGVLIKEEPVYFTAFFPRPFKKMDISLQFKNTDNKLIEFGPQSDPQLDAFDLSGLDHPQLNTIFAQKEKWDFLTKDDTHLMQKRSAYKYQEESQFFSQLPAINEVAYYDASWKKPFLPQFTESQEEAGEPSEIDIPLLGSHEFLLSANETDLDLDFSYVDLNEISGSDEVSIKLFDWKNNLLAQYKELDDGITDESGPSSKEQNLSLDFQAKESPFVYRLRVQASKDIIFRSIKSNAPYFVVKNRLHIAGDPGYVSEFGDLALRDMEIITSARKWNAFTEHRSSLGTIRIGQEKLLLEKPYQNYLYRLDTNDFFDLSSGYKMMPEKGNLIISGRGVFAFNQNQYFSPHPWYLDETIDLDASPINYLWTEYFPPDIVEGDIKRQIISIDLSKVHAPDQSLRFKISIPDLQSGQTIRLDSAEVVYQSDPVTFENAGQKLNRFIKREFRQN